MKEKLYEICEAILQSEEDSKKFLAYETLDELYEYFLKKVPELTKEEFDEFICEVLETYAKEQERETKLEEDALDSVSGGAMGWKERFTAGALALMSFIPAAGATNKKLSDMNERPSQSIGAMQKVKMKVSDAFGKTKAWVKAHPKLTAGIGLGVIALGGITTAIVIKNGHKSKAEDTEKLGKAHINPVNESVLTVKNQVEQKIVPSSDQDETTNLTPAAERKDNSEATKQPMPLPSLPPDKKADQSGKKADQPDKKADQPDKKADQPDKKADQPDKKDEQQGKKDEQPALSAEELFDVIMNIDKGDTAMARNVRRQVEKAKEEEEQKRKEAEQKAKEREQKEKEKEEKAKASGAGEFVGDGLLKKLETHVGSAIQTYREFKKLTKPSNDKDKGSWNEYAEKVKGFLERMNAPKAELEELLKKFDSIKGWNDAVTCAEDDFSGFAENTRGKIRDAFLYKEEKVDLIKTDENGDYGELGFGKDEVRMCNACYMVKEMIETLKKAENDAHSKISELEAKTGAKDPKSTPEGCRELLDKYLSEECWNFGNLEKLKPIASVILKAANKDIKVLHPYNASKELPEGYTKINPKLLAGTQFEIVPLKDGKDTNDPENAEISKENEERQKSFYKFRDNLLNMVATEELPINWLCQ